MLWTDWEATDDFHPDDTDEAKDFEKNQFLDLRKPLLRQVWEANWRFVKRLLSFSVLKHHVPSVSHITSSRSTSPATSLSPLVSSDPVFLR